jgi:hypothetical protein
LVAVKSLDLHLQFYPGKEGKGKGKGEKGRGGEGRGGKEREEKGFAGSEGGQEEGITAPKCVLLGYWSSVEVAPAW